LAQKFKNLSVTRLAAGKQDVAATTRPCLGTTVVNNSHFFCYSFFSNIPNSSSSLSMGVVAREQAN